MTETLLKYTPGPWHVSDKTHVYDSTLRLIAVAQHCKESARNANLIGAAPDLLESLLEVLNWIDDHCETTGFSLIEARADRALAKAGVV